MEVIRGLANIRPQHQGCVVTIGNFDGLHLGHRELLGQLQRKSRELQAPALVIIFEPQPTEFFSDTLPVARLMRFREKLEGLQAQGIEKVLCIRFNEAVVKQAPQQFIQKVLVEKLAIKYVIVGDDFRFGYKRAGSIDLLKQMAPACHFIAQSMPTLALFGERVSSSRIRKLLEAGDLSGAEKLLGSVYTMSGKIVHGDKRGRILGFPTANIFLHRKRVPLSGVFAVKMQGIESSPLYGVANVGTRPTIAGQTKTLLEVHLFNFNQEIYGKHVKIEFSTKIRDEKKFDNLDALKLQIEDDALKAKVYFNL